MSAPGATPAAGRPSGPFGGLRPAVALACLYGAAALVWVAFGAALPGGRWLAVHLFTVGVLTNLVAAMTHHFAQTLLHAPERPTAARLALLNLGALLLLTGLPAGLGWLVAIGATLLSAAVLWLYVALRRMRKSSLTARFAFVVRAYERATSAFVHGALLGALLGTGIFKGGWYAAGRLAHMHINVLGWGGLTLLATLLFFGPTVMRARMEPGADAVAATWLRRSATGLSVAALALLGTGAGAPWALPLRLLASAGLAVYAVGAAGVCLPVLRTGRRANPSPASWMLQAVCAWFVLAAAADALVVATGRTALLDVLGVAALVGVLAQAILAALSYLMPLVFADGADQRSAGQRLLQRLPRLRVGLLNAGVAAVVVSGAATTLGAELGTAPLRIGWLLVASAVGLHLLLFAGAAGRSIPAGAAER